jgi:signal transduction histidine kinase
LEDVVHDMLDLGQMREQSRKPLHHRLVLNDIIRAAVNSLEPQARQKALRFQMSFPDTPCEMTGDRGRLLRALLNLLSNAVKYSPTLGLVSIDLQADEMNWRIAVQDQGPGIPKDAQKHLFERFYRVDHGRSRDMGGTGLGLAIVREVAQAHGGSASVISDPGFGSTFVLHLPRTQDPAS